MGHVSFRNGTLSTLLHVNKNKYCDFYSETHCVGNSQYYWRQWVGFQSCWRLATHIEILRPCWCPVSSEDLCARARGPWCCNIISLNTVQFCLLVELKFSVRVRTSFRQGKNLLHIPYPSPAFRCHSRGFKKPKQCFLRRAEVPPQLKGQDCSTDFAMAQLCTDQHLGCDLTNSNVARSHLCIKTSLSLPGNQEVIL